MFWVLPPSCTSNTYVTANRCRFSIFQYTGYVLTGQFRSIIFMIKNREAWSVSITTLVFSKALNLIRAVLIWPWHKKLYQLVDQFPSFHWDTCQTSQKSSRISSRFSKYPKGYKWLLHSYEDWVGLYNFLLIVLSSRP